MVNFIVILSYPQFVCLNMQYSTLLAYCDHFHIQVNKDMSHMELANVIAKYGRFEQFQIQTFHVKHGQ